MSKVKYIKIEATITIPENETEDIFNEKLLDFMESNGYLMGGGTVEVNENGEPL